MGADPLLALLARPDPARGLPGLPARTLDEIGERLVLLGGTVDTAAQELGLLDERSALDLLGRATGLPALGRADVAGLDVATLPALRTTLPRRLALAHGLCPVALRGRRLTVACRAPEDGPAFAATIDELGFALALTLVPHVTTEALLAVAWETVYGVAVPPRLQAVLMPGTATTTAHDRPIVAGDRSGWSALSTARAPRSTPAFAPEVRDDSGWRIPAPGEVILPSAAMAPPDRAALELVEDGTIPSDAPPLVQARLAALDDAAARALQRRRQKVLWSEGDCVAELALGANRDELLEVMLRFTYRRLRTAAIFVKQGDALVCFDILDPLLESRELRRFTLPADERTLIGRAMTLQSPMLGPVDEEDPLCRLLGRRPRALLVAPIVLGGRSIGAIVGDNDDKPVPAQLVGELQRVLPSLQRALTGLIQRARVAAASAKSAPAPVPLPAAPVAAPATPPATTVAAQPTTASTASTVSTTSTPTTRPPTTPPMAAVAPSPGASARESLLQATWRAWLNAPIDAHTAALITALHGGGASARAAWSRLMALGLHAMPAFAHAFPGTVGVDDADDDDGATFLDGPIGATLVRLGPDLVAPLVVGALDDPDGRRRFGAVALTHALRLEAAVPGLGRRVLDPEPRVARLATWGLLALRDVPAAESVRARLRDLCKRGHDHERRLAIRAVAALRDERAVEPLIDLVGARPREIADEATASLVELCRQDFGSAERRWRAWYTEHKHEPRRRWLVLALIQKDRSLRAAAADELAEEGVALMGYVADAPASERDEALVRLCAALGEPLPT